MQIKVNEAQMQEYADYMDSIPAKLEAAGSAVQSVVSWMQNEEMLSEVSRGHYLTKLERVQRHLSDAATDAGKFGPAIRQIVTNYEQNEKELTDELDSMVEEALSTPILPSAPTISAENTPEHSDLANSAYADALIQLAKNVRRPDMLLSGCYAEQMKNQNWLQIGTVGFSSLINGDVRTVINDPFLIQNYMLDSTLEALLEESGEKIKIYNGFTSTLGDPGKGGFEAIKSTQTAVKTGIMLQLKDAGMESSAIDKFMSTYTKNNADMDEMIKSLDLEKYPNLSGVLGEIKDGMGFLKTVSEGAKVLSDVDKLTKPAYEVLNQYQILQAIDKNRLKETADIYISSGDENMKMVGGQLLALATGDTAEQMKVLATTSVLDNVLNATQESVKKEIDSALMKNPLGASLILAREATNASMNMKDIPKLRNQVILSNENANKAYNVLQERVRAYESNPTAENMNEVRAAYKTYNTMAAESERAVSAVYKKGSQSLFGALTMNKERKGYVEDGYNYSNLHKQNNERFDGLFEKYEKESA